MITPQRITLRVATMGDYADECQRIRDEKVKREIENEQEIVAKADSLLNNEWGYPEFIESLDEADMQTRQQIELARRAKDDATLGMLVRQAHEARAWKVAGGRY